MDDESINLKDAETRERVLAAAGEVFADHGYEKATIREIVRRAGANLNAVNYYFRDKRGLYVALFEQAHAAVTKDDLEMFAKAAEQDPEERLKAIVLRILRGFVLTKRTSWQMRLLIREMIEPTGVLDLMVERFIRPRFSALCEAVRALASPGTPDLTVKLCTESVVGQCAHIVHARLAVQKLIPELTFTPEGLEFIAEHITTFSLAAIRHLSQSEHPA